MRYTWSMTKKYPTSMRLTPTAKKLIEKISDSLGISHAAVLELAIRTLANQYQIKEDKEGTDEKDVS